jgi:transmembrane sensor
MPTRIETLFQKFIDGTCTQQEYNELMDMLQQNQHEEKVRQMLNQVYQHTARSLRSVTYVDTNGDLQTANSEKAEVVIMHRPARRRRLAWAAAAILLLSVGGWRWLNDRKQSRVAQNTVTESTVKKFTQRAEQKYMVLPDSTQVWLNVASTVEFPETFHNQVREVYLTGEAFFDVKHAEDIPFIIHTGNVSIKVLGTAFNIKAYPDQPDVVVAVKRGKVQVSKNDQVVATLTRGQQVKIGPVAQQAVVIPARENAVADWTTGRLSFDSRPFADILKDLERNYNVTIELTDTRLGQEIVTTSFRRDVGIEEALDILCQLANSELKKENGKYIISGKP